MIFKEIIKYFSLLLIVAPHIYSASIASTELEYLETISFSIIIILAIVTLIWIEKLSDKKIKKILLYNKQDFSISEIAKKVDCSNGSVYYWINKE